jgi:hypothetical protein
MVAILFPLINGKGVRNHSTAVFISEGLVVDININPSKTTNERRQQTRRALYMTGHKRPGFLK